MASRAEHRRVTLLTLGEAAVELFDEIGPEATIDAIADRAGVSRRTVFRWFDSKEEMAFVHPILWFDAFNAAVEAPELADADMAALLTAGSQAIAAEVDANPEPVRRAFVVAATNPPLLRGFDAVYQRWVDRFTELSRVESMRRDRPNPLRDRVIGAALMGMVDAITRTWLLSPPGTTYWSVLGDGITVIEPLLE